MAKLNLKADMERLNSSAKKAVTEEKSQFSKTKDDRIVSFGLINKKDAHCVHVRLLPSMAYMEKKNDILIAKAWRHFYTLGSKKVDMRCLVSLGEKCPQCEDLWGSYDAERKEEFKKFMPIRRFYVNAYIIKDDANEDNKGKVVILDLNSQLYEVVQKEIDGGEYNPFDLFNGRNFVIEVKSSGTKGSNGDPIPTFLSSRFSDSPTEFLKGDEDKITAVLTKTYDLFEFLNKKDFMTYDQMREYLDGFSSSSLKKEVKDQIKKDKDIENMDENELVEYMESNNLEIKGWKSMDEEELRKAIKKELGGGKKEEKKEEKKPKDDDDDKKKGKDKDDDDDDDNKEERPKGDKWGLADMDKDDLIDFKITNELKIKGYRDMDVKELREAIKKAMMDKEDE